MSCLDNKLDWEGTLINAPLVINRYKRRWIRPGTFRGEEVNQFIMEYLDWCDPEIDINGFDHTGGYAGIPREHVYESLKHYVNTLYREGSYVSDKDLYDLTRHWEDVEEFYRKGLKGDCDAFAVAVMTHALLNYEQVRLCLGHLYTGAYAEDGYKINHVWVEVKIDGEWWVADATAPKGKVRKNAGLFRLAKRTPNRIPMLSFDIHGNVWTHGDYK